MEKSGNGDKFPTFKLLSSILGSLIVLIFGFWFGMFVTEVKADLRDLHEKKLTKSVYMDDIKDIKDSISCINLKMDQVIDWHLPPELRKHR